ncbi:MAG: branched-chain amino acid ABC transporter permease [Desulfocapsaceae bacterium]
MSAVNRTSTLVTSGALFFLLLPVLAHYLGNPYLLSLFSRVLIYGLAAASLDLLVGYGGLVSLGHAAFVGTGAYVVAIMFHHGVAAEPLLGFISGSENGFIVWPLAVLAAAGAALVIGTLSLRTSGMHFIMITLAFAQMAYYFSVSLEKYGGDDGISLYDRSVLGGLDLGNDISFYYVCFFLLSLFLILAYRLTRSRFGLILRGCGSNPRRIQALGIHSKRYRLVCFVIGGAGAGLAGALLANQTEYVSPALLHWTLSGELLVMVLLGGLGSLFGPVLGATVYLLLEETLAMYTEHWMVYFGPILILVVIFAKQGLFGLLTGAWKSDE